MYAASAQSEVYRCPGEEYSITRSVHLARLATFYTRCNGCPHAGDKTGTAAVPSDQPQQSAGVPRKPSIFRDEGVRGRYLNDITRGTAERLAAAMASCLWDDCAKTGEPIGGRWAGNLAATTSPAGVEDRADVAPEGVRVLDVGPPGPRVVIAHDERPASPDLVIGVGQALRRMGCQVVDIGLATRACFLFAVDHLHAAGGVLVTGSGHDPGWTGLDFAARGSLPCSSPGELDRIAARFAAGFSRPSRCPGSQRSFDASVAYEAGFGKHFHALRPLKIALACPGRALKEWFGRAFRKVACRLIPVETPTRLRNLVDQDDPDLARTARIVRESAADLGVLVAEDGELCLFWDERGEMVPPDRIAALLAGSLEQSSAGSLVLPKAWRQINACAPAAPRQAVETERTAPRNLINLEQPNRERVVAVMREQQAAFAADGQGRYWFADGSPACDALLTLVRVLQALSQSDTPFSQVMLA